MFLLSLFTYSIRLFEVFSKWLFNSLLEFFRYNISLLLFFINIPKLFDNISNSSEISILFTYSIKLFDVIIISSFNSFCFSKILLFV